MTTAVNYKRDILERLREEMKYQKSRQGEEDADDRVYLAWAAIEEIEALRASATASGERIASLEKGLADAAEDLQLVGDDYPDSSCHKWCSESASKARAILAKGETK